MLAASTCSTLPRNVNSFFAGCCASQKEAQITVRETTGQSTTRETNPLTLISMPVLPPRRFLFRFEVHDFFVRLLRQDADQSHHASRESAPAGRHAVRFRLLNLLVHGHHWTFHEGVLRK